jgi:hypothetical protein
MVKAPRKLFIEILTVENFRFLLKVNVEYIVDKSR